ncbi:MAG: hypothetical protein WAR79_16925 [Melioribacteraceae bacterium]
MKNILNKFFLVLVLNISSAFAQNNFTFEKFITGNNYSETRELKINILNNGIFQYFFTKTLIPYQSIPEINVLDNYKCCLIFSQEGLVEFYENNQLQKQHYVYKSHQQNEQSIISVSNTKKVALLISENFNNRIFLLDLNGEIEDSIYVEDGIFSGLSISENSEIIAASFYNWENENIINQTKIINIIEGTTFYISDKFSMGKFNEDENLFLGFTNKNSFCVNLNEQKLLWKEILGNDEIYLDGILSNRNSVLIKSNYADFENGNWIYKSAEIFSKTESGEKIIINKLSSPFKKVSLDKINYKLNLNLDNEFIEIDKQIN